MVATYWAGGAAWTAFSPLGFGGGAAYVSLSATFGYASAYATARINGASNDEALRGALLSAERAAGMAGLRMYANAMYKGAVGYDPDPSPGKELPNQGKDFPAYTYDESTGQVPKADVFGLNRAMDGSRVLDRLSQGSAFGRFMNQIWGMNAIATMDDSMFVRELPVGGPDAFALRNLPAPYILLPLTIPTAAVITTCALACEGTALLQPFRGFGQ